MKIIAEIKNNSMYFPTRLVFDKGKYSYQFYDKKWYLDNIHNKDVIYDTLEEVLYVIKNLYPDEYKLIQKQLFKNKVIKELND